MDISSYKIPAYKVINFMNHHDYLLSGEDLKNNSTLPFPELIKFPPPPKEYWDDFAKILRMSFGQ